MKCLIFLDLELCVLGEETIACQDTNLDVCVTHEDSCQIQWEYCLWGLVYLCIVYDERHFHDAKHAGMQWEYCFGGRSTWALFMMKDISMLQSMLGCSCLRCANIFLIWELCQAVHFLFIGSYRILLSLTQQSVHHHKV